ncbi:MAG TPA: hypothetical protein VIN06_00180 [Devosia sp.]
MIAAAARAWLVASTTALGLPLGALVLLIFHRLTGGRWGEASKPVLAAIASTLPLWLLLFAPLLAAVPLLMPFINAAPETLPARIVNKLGYFEPGWLVLRTLVIAAMWLVASVLVLPGRLRVPLGPQPAAVVALVLYAGGMLVFTTDWMVALEPEFVSTIYPILVFGAQVTGALAAATVGLRFKGLLAGRQSGGEATKLSGDFAKLMMAAVLSWVYFAYMQWLVIWIGNLPWEAGWYTARLILPWPIAFWIMALGMGLLPFLAFLLRAVRQRGDRVAAIAALILAGYVAEGIWRVGAAFPPDAAYLVLLVVAHLVATGIMIVAVRASLARTGATETTAGHA